MDIKNYYILIHSFYEQIGIEGFQEIKFLETGRETPLDLHVRMSLERTSIFLTEFLGIEISIKNESLEKRYRLFAFFLRKDSVSDRLRSIYIYNFYIRYDELLHSSAYSRPLKGLFRAL